MGKRCLTAGIQILEAKITELSYANEIAEVMLKTHLLMLSLLLEIKLLMELLV